MFFGCFINHDIKNILFEKLIQFYHIILTSSKQSTKKVGVVHYFVISTSKETQVDMPMGLLSGIVVSTLLIFKITIECNPTCNL
jgi:hypothetical protein